MIFLWCGKPLNQRETQISSIIISIKGSEDRVQIGPAQQLSWMNKRAGTGDSLLNPQEYWKVLAILERQHCVVFSTKGGFSPSVTTRKLDSLEQTHFKISFPRTKLYTVKYTVITKNKAFESNMSL